MIKISFIKIRSIIDQLQFNFCIIRKVNVFNFTLWYHVLDHPMEKNKNRLNWCVGPFANKKSYFIPYEREMNIDINIRCNIFIYLNTVRKFNSNVFM